MGNPLGTKLLDRDITGAVKGPRQSFDTWMVLVDRYVSDRSGLGVYDLPDCCFADWHARGMSPLTAARKAIRAAKNGEGI